jgi:hypothetical protein
MLQLLLELLPFAVFLGMGIFAVTEQRTPQRVKKAPRAQRFCGYLDGESLVMADPDGTLVPRTPALEDISRFSIGRRQ